MVFFRVVAPEVIEVAGHSTKSDVWSVGTTVYQLIMGEPPHFDLQPLAAMYRIVKERHPPLPKPCSEVQPPSFLFLFFTKGKR
jgi:serine/threonine protein kinase